MSHQLSWTANATNRRPALGAPLLLLVATGCLSANAQLFINPTFDSSITGSPDGATIIATINSALQVYQSAITTPVTIRIQFKVDESISLGQSLTAYNTISYAQYRADLAARAVSANDATALAHLPVGSANPVNGSTTMELTLAQLRAIGETALGNNSGGFDSTISLKASLMNLARTGPQDSGKYDLKGTLMHEINEVLGLNSSLNGLANGASVPTGAIGSLDLFRYDLGGNRSFSTDVNAGAYLSIDGTTRLVAFNQNAGGDFHDFASPTPYVQNAFGTPGTQTDLQAAELTALDAIGYNFTSVPEPQNIALAAAAALVCLAGVRKLRAA